MDKISASNVREMVVKYRKLFVNRGWATSQLGGIAIRIGTEVYHLPTVNECKLLGKTGAVAQKVTTGTKFTDDVHSGLWGHCFITLSPAANAMIHTTSTNGMIVSEWYSGGVTFGSEHAALAKMLYRNINDKTILPVIEAGSEPDFGTLLLQGIDTKAIMVREHGLFLWDDTVVETVQRCEELERIFEYAVKMNLQPSTQN